MREKRKERERFSFSFSFSFSLLLAVLWEWERDGAIALACWLVFGKGLGSVHKSTGLLRCCHVFSFIQFLYICQHLNGFSVLMYWTQVIPFLIVYYAHHSTRWEHLDILRLKNRILLPRLVSNVFHSFPQQRFLQNNNNNKYHYTKLYLINLIKVQFKICLG